MCPEATVPCHQEGCTGKAGSSWRIPLHHCNYRIKTKIEGVQENTITCEMLYRHKCIKNLILKGPLNSQNEKANPWWQLVKSTRALMRTSPGTSSSPPRAGEAWVTKHLTYQCWLVSSCSIFSLWFSISATQGDTKGWQKDVRRSGAALSQQVSWAWIWFRTCFVSGYLVPGMWGGWRAADHTAGITAFIVCLRT